MAYLSSAVETPTGQVLDDILSVSRRNNAARGVTGMLCHYDGSFLQFLEGEAADVEAVFSVIAADPRHRGLVRLYARSIQSRLFPHWSMALARPGDLDPENRAFGHALRDLKVGVTGDHAELVAPFLATFRAWMR